MGEVEKTAQFEPEEAGFFPTMELWFETGICDKISALTLSKNQKINCPSKRGNSSFIRQLNHQSKGYQCDQHARRDEWRAHPDDYDLPNILWHGNK